MPICSPTSADNFKCPPYEFHALTDACLKFINQLYNKTEVFTIPILYIGKPSKQSRYFPVTVNVDIFGGRILRKSRHR